MKFYEEIILHDLQIMRDMQDVIEELEETNELLYLKNADLRKELEELKNE